MDNILNSLVILVALCSGLFLAFYYIKLLLVTGKKSAVAVKYQKQHQLLSFLDGAVKSSVAATNQTMVEALKKSESFFQQEKEEAFTDARTRINRVLAGKDMKELSPYIGDIDEWIRDRIEYYVRLHKG